MEIVIHTICTLTVLLLHKTKHKRYFLTQALSCPFQCLFELSAFSLNGHEEDTAVFFCTYFSTKFDLWEMVHSCEKKNKTPPSMERKTARKNLPATQEAIWNWSLYILDVLAFVSIFRTAFRECSHCVSWRKILNYLHMLSTVSLFLQALQLLWGTAFQTSSKKMLISSSFVKQLPYFLKSSNLWANEFDFDHSEIPHKWCL